MKAIFTSTYSFTKDAPYNSPHFCSCVCDYDPQTRMVNLANVEWLGRDVSDNDDYFLENEVLQFGNKTLFAIPLPMKDREPYKGGIYAYY